MFIFLGECFVLDTDDEGSSSPTPLSSVGDDVNYKKVIGQHDGNKEGHCL
jgi:hypothetical protein